MKRLVFAAAVIVAALHNQAVHAAPAECFASSAAVFAAHPNASHASYIGKRAGSPGRCWFADSFRARTPGDAKVTRRTAAAATSALRPSIAVPSTTAVAPVQAPAVVPAPVPVTSQYSGPILPSLHIAVEARQPGRVQPADPTPADFESRFSASGYTAPK